MNKFGILFFSLSLIAFVSAGCNTPQRTENNTNSPSTRGSLVSVTAQLQTTSDDKNDDTKLEIWVTDKQGFAIAQDFNIFGKYDDNSEHNVSLEIKGEHGKTALKGSKIHLRIVPKDEDQWNFDVKLEFKFSDGSTFVSNPLKGNVMTERNPNISLLIDFPNG